MSTAIATRPTADLEPGFVQFPTEEAYYADRRFVTRSALEDMRRSVRLFRAKWIDLSIVDEPTPAMALGSALHAAVLTPATFEANYRVPPKFDRRTKEGKAGAEAFAIEAAGKTLIDQADFDTVRAMADAIHDHPMARALLGACGIREQPFAWKDATTGLLCKGKADAIGRAFILDIKTAADPDPDQWGKHCDWLGYHRQAAYYLDGAAASFAQGELLSFVHIVVGKQPPHDVYCLELDERSVGLGRTEISQALDELSYRLKANNWTPRLHDSIHSVSLPAYRFNRKEAY